MTKATFGATVGLIGAFVAKSLGGWDAALITLLTPSRMVSKGSRLAGGEIV